MRDGVGDLMTDGQGGNDKDLLAEEVFEANERKLL